MFQQLTNALLEVEEERAVCSAKEKASVEAINEKVHVYNDEITSLSSELSKVNSYQRTDPWMFLHGPHPLF